MEIAQNYQTLIENIARLATASGRPPEDVQLIAVSKTFRWQEVAPAYETGCRDFGENRVQDLLPKAAQAPQDVRWHFIGTLQKNKVNKVVGHCALIHSVDTPELAQKISEVSHNRGLVTDVLLQVNTSGEVSKHGLTTDQWRERIDEVKGLPGLNIRGLMTMAPLTDEPEIIRRCFRGLRQFRDELGFRELSMGMTPDYHIAIEEGATMIRIGSALFGQR